MSTGAVAVPPHAAVVYQPLKTDREALEREVEIYERRAAWSPTRWYETSADDAGVAATQQAIADGASVILGCGGDGTVRAISEAMRRSGVPLALIPQGTGNLLARNLHVPLNDLGEAVRAAFFGRDRAIDLGVLTIVREDDSESEHVFLVLAGMGLDARAISATKATLKKRLGWLAYVDGGLRTILKDKPLHMHYSVDGEPARSSSVYTVMIGNCGVLPGGVLLIPDAKIDDGKLDVVALRPLGPFSWLSIWNKVAFENGVLRKTRAGRKIIDLRRDTKSVTYMQVERYGLSVHQPESIQLDGDDFGYAVAASGRVDPGSLIVRTLPEWAG